MGIRIKCESCADKKTLELVEYQGELHGSCDRCGCEYIGNGLSYVADALSLKRELFMALQDGSISPNIIAKALCALVNCQKQS